MILPDGYSDVPAGKIATVVTHLEMTTRPTPSSAPSGPWMLRHVERPDLAWYRDLYRRVGEEYLWFSRIRSADDKLAARLHHPLVGTHALVADGRDEGLLELDFREPGTCEIGMFGVGATLRRAQAVASAIRAEAPEGAAIATSAIGAEAGKSSRDARWSRRVEIRVR